MTGPRYLAIAVAVMTMIAALPAASQIELRFSPEDQHVAVGEAGSLAVILDAEIEVRTFEIWISFDTTLVTDLAGHPGQLFANSGCPLFPFFDEEEPGSFYSGCVTMGPTCFLTGPGELFRWDFEGLDNGICHVQVDSLVLYNPLADVIEGVSLSGTTIVVGTVSSVNTPSAQRLTLALAPNPFNPRTTISFGGQPDESVSVEVFDLRGRRLATLWRGILGTEPGNVQWDGTDGKGRSVPGGAYLFRIFGQGNRQLTRKGILLK